jgi:hypothetical protein
MAAHRREAIVYLIVNKFITDLSIEGPPAVNHTLNINNPAQTQQRIRDVSTGGSGSLEPNDYYSFHKLVSIAQKYRVDTYFHDLPPMTGSRGNAALHSRRKRIVAELEYSGKGYGESSVYEKIPRPPAIYGTIGHKKRIRGPVYHDARGADTGACDTRGFRPHANFPATDPA